MGTNLQVNNIKIDIFASKVTLENFSLSFSNSHSNKKEQINLSGKKLTIRINPTSLFEDKIIFNKIYFDQIKLFCRGKNILKNKKDSSHNLKLLLERFSSYDFIVKKLYITNSSFSFFSNNNNLSISSEGTNIYAHNISKNSPVNLYLSGKRINLYQEQDYQSKIKNFYMSSQLFLSDSLTPEYFNIEILLFGLSNKNDKIDSIFPQASKINIDLKGKLSSKSNILKLKKLNILEEKNGNTISNISSSGKFSFKPFNFNLKTEIKCVSQDIVNIIENFCSNIRFRNTDFSYNGRIKYSFNKLKLNGKLDVKNFSMSKNGYNLLSPNKKISIKGNYNFLLNFKTKELAINKINTKLTINNKEVASLISHTPLKLLYKNKNVKLKNNNGELNKKANVLFNIKDLDLSIFENLFVYFTDLNSISGTLNAKNKFELKNIYKIKSKGKIEISDFKLKTKNFKCKKIDIKSSYKADFIDTNKITLKKALTKFYRKDQKLAELNFQDTFYNIREKRAKFYIKSRYLTDNLEEYISYEFSNKDNTLKEIFNELDDEIIIFNTELNLNFSNKAKIKINKLNIDLLKDDSNIAHFSLQKPLYIDNLANIGLIYKNSYEAKLQLYNYPLKNLSFLIPQKLKKKLKIKTGDLDADLLFSSKNYNKNTIKVEGKLNSEELSLLYNNKLFSDIKIKQKLNVFIKNFSKVVGDSLVEVDIKDKRAIEFNSSFHYNNNPSSYNLSLSELFINAEYLNQLPLNKKFTGIKTLKASGDLDISYIDKENSYRIKMDIFGEKLRFFQKKNSEDIPSFNGNISLDIKLLPERTKINKLISKLSTKKYYLGTMKGKGNLRFPLTKGTSKLKLSFTKLKLKKLLKFINKIKIYPKLNLRETDFNFKISARDSSYGAYIIFNLKTILQKNGKILKVSPFKLTANKTPIKGKLIHKLGQKDAFLLNCQFQNLALNPFIKTFTNSPLYNKSKGKIKKFDISLKGKGFSEKELKQNINGDANIILKDLYLPNSTKEIDFLSVMFFPFNTMTKVEKLVKDKDFTKFCKNLMNYSENVLENNEDLHISGGKFKLDVNKGKIKLEKCKFDIISNIINEIIFKGYIGLNKTFDLI